MGKISDQTIYSQSLQEEIHLFIYVPANYSPLNKYTICIANDGKDYFQMGRIGRVADTFIHEKKIENMIIVGVPYNDIHDRRSKYHPDGEKHEAYIRFLAHELVPFLDETYSTYGIGHGRALIGDSLAGTISFLTAMRYPNTFGKVLMQSPYVDDHVLQAVRNFNEPHLLQLDHTIGLLENNVPTTDGKRSNFIEPNRILHQLLVEKQFSMYYNEFEGDHTWKHWQKDLPRAIQHLFAR